MLRMRILILLLFCISSATCYASDDRLPVAPNIIGKTLKGERFALSRETGTIVVNLFSVDCKPCATEMPELAKLAKDFPNIKFIAVNTDDKEEQAVRQFIHGLTAYPQTVVVASSYVQRLYNVRGLPYTVIVNDGKVSGIYEGYTKQGLARLKQRLEAISNRNM